MKTIAIADVNELVIFKQTEVKEKYEKYQVEGDNRDLEILPVGIIVRSYKNNMIKIICSYKIDSEE